MDPNSANIAFPSTSYLVTVLVPVFAALIGALAGGYMTYLATLRGVRLTHEKDLQSQRESEKAALQSLYRSIRAEIKTLWDHYQESMGQYVENLKTGQALTREYVITQEYFTIYRNNSALIGRIPDDMLREQIIKTYIKAQAIVETYRANNYLLGKVEHYNELSLQGTPPPNVKSFIDAAVMTMVIYTGQIKDSHNNLKEEMHKLLDMLENKIESAY